MTDLSKSILILEADEGLADVMAELLDREGSHVTITRTVRDAVAGFTVHALGAVILDLDTIPLGDNELMIMNEWLDTPMGAPPLIVLSVSVPRTEAIDVLATTLLGPDQSVLWLGKPFRKQDLLDVVRWAMRLEAWAE